MQRLDLRTIIGVARPIIGMVHLRPLPGAPRHLSLLDVLEAARRDAHALAAGGVDAIIVENFGDVPFVPECVPPETIAAMTRAVLEVRAAAGLPVGVNVLRNDARAALAVAAVTQSAFIRVNVHTGAMITDQGWIDGRAHETLRARAALSAEVAIVADVLVKHATPPVAIDIGNAAADTWERGCADALVVSGIATGAATRAEDLRAVRAAVPHATLLIGSGITPASAAALLDLADGAIIGSAFEQDGRAGNPVDPQRVRTLLQAIGRP